VPDRDHHRLRLDIFCAAPQALNTNPPSRYTGINCCSGARSQTSFLGDSNDLFRQARAPKPKTQFDKAPKQHLQPTRISNQCRTASPTTAAICQRPGRNQAAEPGGSPEREPRAQISRGLLPWEDPISCPAPRDPPRWGELGPGTDYSSGQNNVGIRVGGRRRKTWGRRVAWEVLLLRWLVRSNEDEMPTLNTSFVRTIQPHLAPTPGTGNPNSRGSTAPGTPMVRSPP
jgi:hypothetical protein